MPTTTDSAVKFNAAIDNAITTSVRSGLARLLEWLTCHPDIPVSYVSYADNVSVELCLPAGRFDRLATAADVADALAGSTIAVTDPPGKRMTWLTIAGTVAGDSGSGLEVLVSTSVYDQARAALLASLGCPPNPSQRAWDVTAAHLRGLVEAASSAAGA